MRYHLINKYIGVSLSDSIPPRYGCQGQFLRNSEIKWLWRYLDLQQLVLCFLIVKS